MAGELCGRVRATGVLRALNVYRSVSFYRYVCPGSPLCLFTGTGTGTGTTGTFFTGTGRRLCDGVIRVPVCPGSPGVFER